MNDSRIYDHVLKILSNPILFKYYDAGTSISALEKRSLQFSHPSIFNDPFDCNVNLFKFTEEDVTKHFEYISNKYAGNNYYERFRYNRNFKEKILPDYKTHMQNMFEIENANRGISCFSRINNNLLMWAHYADNHQGVCIGYDTLKLRHAIVDYNRESTFLSVSYVDKIEPKEYFSERDDSVDYWFTTKHKLWEYEQEMRLISRGFEFDHTKKHLFTIPKDVISEIYLGYVISKENEDKILDLIRNSLDHVKLYRITPNYTSFELDILKLN